MNPPQVPRYRSGDYGPWWSGKSIPVPFLYPGVNMQNAVHPAHSNSDQGGYASGSQSDKSPLSNIPFLKNLGGSGEKKQTKDGQPAKRRGPKPDSKPAMTRRQELNRQAQRTHRERKEQYIKALEQEVLRLKEIFSDSTRERDQIKQENQRLKALLAQHGISYDFGDSPVKFQRENSGGANTSYHPSSSGSISGSYRTGSESTAFSPPGSNGMSQAPSVPPLPNHLQGPQGTRSAAQLPNANIDYDDIGIDFVLTYDSQGNPIQVPAPHPYPSPPLQQQGLLERPCMDHMQYLVVRSHNSEGQEFRHPLENADDRMQDNMSGHALMATCPPYSHVMGKPNEPFPHKMPNIDMPDLTKLLDLSARLPIDHEGEITPVMAWTQVYTHPRVNEMTRINLERIKSDLAGKCRCYGFGAVLEEFEVSDAIATVLAERDGMMDLSGDIKAPPQQMLLPQ